MFLEGTCILTWETDVDIKEKGCVSTKLKVCEKCFKWSQTALVILDTGVCTFLQSTLYFTLTFHVFMTWPRSCLLSRHREVFGGCWHCLPAKVVWAGRHRFPFKWGIWGCQTKALFASILTFSTNKVWISTWKQEEGHLNSADGINLLRKRKKQNKTEAIN